MTTPRRLAATVLCLLTGLAAAGCGGETEQSGPVVTASPRATESSPPSGSSAPSAGGTSATEESSSPDGPPRVVRDVVTGLEVPWGLDFLPGGRAVVTERDSGRVLLVRPGQATGVGNLNETDAEGEAGLLGVAVSPEFASDRMLYFYVTTEQDNRVVRAPLRNGSLGATEPVLTGIPKGFIHDGGQLLFDDEGMLFVSTGETGEAALAQDRDNLGGKILRITPDGEPAPGNPFPDSPVYSYGHRNVQGLAFDDRGRLWASEFGADAFDELNLIQPGNNYGWPIVEGTGDNPDLTNPQAVWSTDEASPSGLAFVDGHVWMASLQGQRLWRVDVSDDQARNPRDFFVGDYGRMRGVALAPSGNLWVTTSNRDGRGDPNEGDDRIIAVRP